MRWPHVLWLGLAACARPAPQAPIAAVCTPERIGNVAIHGGVEKDARAALAPVAVLEGTLDNPARAERVATLATEALRAEGYPRAAVALERKPGCGVELVAHVTLGPRYRIGVIQFETDDDFPADRRLALIEDALGKVNTVGGTYVADRLDGGIAELQRRYRDEGWATATVGRAEADYDDVTGKVALRIPIHAGPRFKIGVIRAIGARGEGRQIFDALGLGKGEYYDRAALTEGLARARKRLDKRIRVRAVVSKERGTIDLDAIVVRPTGDGE